MSINNTNYGTSSLNNNSGDDNSAFGAYAAYNNLDGSCNTAIGSNSLFYNTTGNYNTGVGAGSLTNNDVGSRNTAVGSSALEGLVANQSVGNRNTAVGAQALFSNAGDYNTGIGTYAALDITTGNYNTFLGANTGFDNIANTYEYSTALGYEAKIYASNQIVMGTSNSNIMIPGTARFQDYNPLSYNDLSIVAKQYVDAIATGLVPSISCLCATTASINGGGTPSGSPPTTSTDGVTITNGDNVLVINQGGANNNRTNNVNNGLWIVNLSGDWSRPASGSMSVGTSAKGDFNFIQSGTNYGARALVQISNPAIVGTNSLQYTLFYQLNVGAGQGLNVTSQSGKQIISVDSSLNFINYLDNSLGPNAGTLNIGALTINTIIGPTGTNGKPVIVTSGITGPTGSFSNLYVSGTSRQDGLINAPGGITGATGSFTKLYVSGPSILNGLISGNSGITGATGSFTNVSTNAISFPNNNVQINGSTTQVNQGVDAVAVGSLAGQRDQGAYSTAVGVNAGQTNQGANAVAVGINAGQTNQGQYAVAIGEVAGRGNQGVYSVAVGAGAATLNQRSNAVAVGVNAGNNGQGASTIAVGNSAGRSNQGSSAVAIGLSSGENNQGTNAIAIGIQAGQNSQQSNSVSIGNSAGQSNQANEAVAIGFFAGNFGQSANTIAIGRNAGETSQNRNAIAIGVNSALLNQGSDSIAIGNAAGRSNQGTNAIAIGSFAGLNNQPANSIVINASGGGLNGATQSAFYANPVRLNNANTAGNMLNYNTSTSEISYTSNVFYNNGTLRISGETNITGGNVINFGSDQVKEPNAGKIGYGTFNSDIINALCIVGASPLNSTGNPRTVRIYDSLLVNSNVGIGTTSPSAPLHVIANSTASPETNGVYIYNPTNSANQHAICAMRVAGTSAGNAFSSYDVNGEIGWSAGMLNIDNTYRISAIWDDLSNNTMLAISLAGNVGIGTNNPAHRLDVNGEVRCRNRLFIGVNNPGIGAGDTAYLEYVSIVPGGEQTTLRIVVENDTPGSISDNINLNPTGNVGVKTDTPDSTLQVNGTCKATTFVSDSDYRLKTNIEPLLSSRTIDDLKPVEYDLSGNTHDMGFIAHEVEEVFPFLVYGTKDGENMQSLNYTGLIALLTKEIQDLKRENKCFKERLDKLESKIL